MKTVVLLSRLIISASFSHAVEIKEYKAGPCNEIQASCLKAGFFMFGPNRGLSPKVDCVKLVVDVKKNNFRGPNGQLINISEKTINECRAQRSKGL